MTSNKKEVEDLFWFAQSYGQTLRSILEVCRAERPIILKNVKNEGDHVALRFIGMEKNYMEPKLRNMLDELEQKHGFCMPGLTKLRTYDQDCFFRELFLATPK